METIDYLILVQSFSLITFGMTGTVFFVLAARVLWKERGL